jgi:hypothetical protein
MIGSKPIRWYTEFEVGFESWVNRTQDVASVSRLSRQSAAVQAAA